MVRAGAGKCGPSAETIAGRGRDLTYIGHHLVYPQTEGSRRPLRQFVAWFFRELGLPRPVAP